MWYHQFKENVIIKIINELKLKGYNIYKSIFLMNYYKVRKKCNKKISI